MSLISFVLIITGVILNAAAQLLLKAGTNAVGHFEFQTSNIVPVGLQLAFQPYILSGMVCYAISLVVWIMALSRVPVSIAYPMLSIGYVINALIAWHWLGEAISGQKLLGISFIILGVVLITKS
jgi:multidrug transporter EmrE-like cation transporter